MRVYRSLADLPAQGLGGVFVPTMGALHAGHAALVRHAADLARRRALPQGACVSIFVNPTQFNDPADLARYPRTLDADLALCQHAGADAVFAPGPDDIYPPSAAIPTPPLPPAAANPGLEDASRPGHFAGVCQVVKRLFDLVRPAAAVFGEKDWQQLAVIRAMTLQQRLPIEIIGHPTIREPGGLAMSSRNVFLTPTQRAAALAISWALCAACRAAHAGEAQRVMARILERAGLETEYAVIRDADTLAPVAPSSTGHARRPLRALIAARAGKTRLIDNAAWAARR